MIGLLGATLAGCGSGGGRSHATVVTVTDPHAPKAKLQALGQTAAKAHLGKLVKPPGYQG